jgi:hypothetical protein
VARRRLGATIRPRDVALAGLAVLAAASALAQPAVARPSPAALYHALGARATWTTGLPPRFTVGSAVRYPSGDPGFVGQVFLYLKGPLAGQGLGFIVTTSAATAEADFLGIVRDREAKRRGDEPAGSFWWTALDTGATSQCDSPQIVCHETNLAMQVRNVIVVASVGSARGGSALAARDLRQLFNAAVARLRSLAG